MSSRTLNRKDFLIVTVTAVTASVIAACGGDDPVSPGGTAGSGTGGSGGAGGSGTAGSGTAGSGTAGTGTAGSASGGTGTAGSGTSGSGGMSGGSGGASGGTGGASGGSGGASGGSAGAGGGGGGGMCGTVATLMHTSNNQHTHIPADSTQLKMSLKTLINGNMATMEFTLPSDGQGGGHVHKIKLSAAQVTTLKGGGTVTGLVSFDTTEGEATHTGHTHTYTIGCTA